VPGCGRGFQEHKEPKDFLTAEPMIGIKRGFTDFFTADFTDFTDSDH
jgi:hypothetical protein